MTIKYCIEFSPNAEKDFAKLGKAIQKRIFTKLKFFENQENPFPFAKKLTGTDNYFRFRIGDYRLIFTVKNKNVFTILLILKIAHRREVYD